MMKLVKGPRLVTRIIALNTNQGFKEIMITGLEDPEMPKEAFDRMMQIYLADLVFTGTPNQKRFGLEGLTITQIALSEEIDKKDYPELKEFSRDAEV